MGEDLTELRRHLAQEVNKLSRSRAQLEEAYEEVCNTQELMERFNVIWFGALFVSVRRKSDGKQGSFMFQHSPRFYFGFKED